MSNRTQLYGFDPVGKQFRSGHVRFERIDDIDRLLVVGRRVRRAGISETTMHVVGFHRERQLVAIQEDGHSLHMNSMEGSRYFTSKIMVFKYRTEAVGNELHVIIPYDRVFEFPLKEGAGY